MTPTTVSFASINAIAYLVDPYPVKSSYLTTACSVREWWRSSAASRDLVKRSFRSSTFHDQPSMAVTFSRHVWSLIVVT